MSMGRGWSELWMEEWTPKNINLLKQNREEEKGRSWEAIG